MNLFILYSLLALLALIAMSALSSALETAITSLSRMQIHEIESQKSKRSRVLSHLVSQMDNTLTALLLCTNLANIAAATLASAVTIRLWGEIYLGLISALLTFILLIFAEVSPKRIALNSNLSLALNFAIPLFLLSIILLPFTRFISGLSTFVVKLFPREEKVDFSLRALRSLSKEAVTKGDISQQEHLVLSKMAQFDEINIRDICTHRADIVSLAYGATLKEALTLIKNTFFSYYPVYKDDQENIVGVIKTEDILKIALEKGLQDLQEIYLSDLIHEPMKIPASYHLSDFMKKIQQEQFYIGIVLDEYGGLTGVITPADVAYSVLGLSIGDNDIDRIADVQATDDPKVWHVQGDMDLSDFAEYFNIGPYLEVTAAKTLAGYLMEHSNTVLKVNDSLELEFAVFTILSTINNKIEQVVYQQK